MDGAADGMMGEKLRSNERLKTVGTKHHSKIGHGGGGGRYCGVAGSVGVGGSSSVVVEGTEKRGY